MKERIVLFDVGNYDEVSPSFWINSQLTVVAFGLAEEDEITFEAVAVPAPLADPCKCPPSKVSMPSVADRFPLQCCGEDIKITSDRPYVILDAPQHITLRAVLHSKHPELIRAWAATTNTPNLSQWQKGCGCDNKGV